MAEHGKFSLKIMDPDRVLFNGEVSVLFLQGDTGEFELLPYHYPVLSLLRRGKIILGWNSYIPIKKGIVKFFKNECTILVEQDE